MNGKQQFSFSFSQYTAPLFDIVQRNGCEVQNYVCRRYTGLSKYRGLQQAVRHWRNWSSVLMKFDNR